MDLTEARYIVPCRSGSKRLPGKNWLPLGGKPLIRWTLDLLDELGLRDRTIIVDDAGGLHHRELGRYYLERPPLLATDIASSEDVVRFALAALGVLDHAPVMLLQPTSPFRRSHHLCAVLELHDLNPVISGTPGDGPDGAYYLAIAHEWFRREQIADGPVHWWDSLGATGPDIDAAEDLAAAELALEVAR